MARERLRRNKVDFAYDRTRRLAPWERDHIVAFLPSATKGMRQAGGVEVDNPPTLPAATEEPLADGPDDSS